MISTAKHITRSKGVLEFSLELCSKMWVPVMEYIVRQAKLSENTLEKHLSNLFVAQFPHP